MLNRAALLLIVSVGCASVSADELSVFIVAGQSNAVGFDTDARQLPDDATPEDALLWFRCGDPPADKFDTSSDHKWVPLGAQPKGVPRTPRGGRQYGNFRNESGFGPEISFAKHVDSHVAGRVAIIKVAYSGTNVAHDWDPNGEATNGNCYRALISETKLAMEAARKAGHKPTLKGLVWIQGESDANAAMSKVYSANLIVLLTSIKRELNSPGLAVTLGVNTRFQAGRNNFMPTIVSAQQEVARSMKRCVYVDTSSATVINPAHFDSKGTLLVGKLCAEAYLKLAADD